MSPLRLARFPFGSEKRTLAGTPAGVQGLSYPCFRIQVMGEYFCRKQEMKRANSSL